MERSTNEQRNFKDAMIILIDLYYLVKDIDNKLNIPINGIVPLTPSKKKFIKTTTDLLFNKPIITLLAKLFHKTIPNFSPCEFFSNPPFFHYRLAQEFICFETPNGKSHPFQEFIELMDAMQNRLPYNTYDPIRIKKVTREYYAHKKSKIRIRRENFEMIVKDKKYSGPYKEIGKYGNDGDYPWVYDTAPENNEHKSAAISDFLWMNYDDTRGNICKLTYMKEDVKCRIMPIIPERMVSDYSSDAILKNLNVPPPYYELFNIESPAVTGLPHYFKNIEMVSSPGYLKEKTDFFNVIRFILVKYVSLFGSFDRVKVCKKCGKLFFEKKYGSSIFCNVHCRVNFHIASEPEDIIKCRARQNRWLGRKLLNPDTIKKDDCKNCQEQRSLIKGGMCQKVQEKNKKIFDKPKTKQS